MLSLHLPAETHPGNQLGWKDKLTLHFMVLKASSLNSNKVKLGVPIHQSTPTGNGYSSHSLELGVCMWGAGITLGKIDIIPKVQVPGSNSWWYF